MASRHFSDASRGGHPGLGSRGTRGSMNVRITLLAILVVVGALVAMTLVRGQRAAAWAPLNVVSSRDPLQELPIRVAGRDGVVRPAHTYDAVLDMSHLSSLVVGVDLDIIPKGALHYEAVIRDQNGGEIFRDTIDQKYFSDGRFMLRLFPRKFHAGEYMLEVESGGSTGSTQVVAASWFQVLP